MAKASTTHVIEIETGIGEPAFIPLTLGQELQPISVGKKGMWRIESARVLDVHAFVYFDGTSLFVQSADESVAASVDGHPVGKAWTELHAPCKIEIGAAKLRYRSLLPAAATPQAEAPARPRANTGAPPRASASAPPPAEAPPLTFPKPERPFKPGEFASSAGQGESTRVAPLDGAGGRSNVTGTMPPKAAAGRVEDDNPTRLEGSGSVRAQQQQPTPPMRESTVGLPGAPVRATAPGMGMPHPPTQPMRVQPMPPMQHGMTPMQPMQPMGPGMMPMQPAPPGMMQPGMMGPGGSGYYQQYPGPAGAGPYGYMEHGPFMGQGPTTGGQVGNPPEGLIARYLAKYKELSLAKRLLIILAPFSVVSSAYLLLVDDPPETGGAPHTRAPLVQSATRTQPHTAPSNAPPSSAPVPAQPSCPPGFVLYPIQAPNGAIACVPSSSPPPPSNTPPPPSNTPPPPPPPAVSDGGAPSASLGSTTKTLERQAVDYVAANDYARAAAVYEQLQAQNPSNRVYAEAARILRAKADAGTP